MNWLLGIVIALGAILFGWLCYEDSKHWDAFNAEHHCKVVGRHSGDVATIITSDGKVGTATTSSKTGWLCDDGVTYWR